MADVAVELMDRKPIRVVRTAFSILTFDDEGFLDSTAFEQHQRARAELALAPALDRALAMRTSSRPRRDLSTMEAAGRPPSLWRNHRTRGLGTNKMPAT